MAGLITMSLSCREEYEQVVKVAVRPMQATNAAVPSKSECQAALGTISHHDHEVAVTCSKLAGTKLEGEQASHPFPCPEAMRCLDQTAMCATQDALHLKLS